MENIEQPKKNEYFNYKLQFKGEGADYFGILIVNFLLSILTLGLYYPWAKERQLKYLYNTTFLNDHAFVFSGGLGIHVVPRALAQPGSDYLSACARLCGGGN